MFSHALVSYQQAVMQFFVKTTETFSATSKSLSLEPHYNFSIFKELTQSEKQEELPTNDTTDGILDLSANEAKIDTDEMLFFQDEFKDEDPSNQNKSSIENNEVNLLDIPNTSENSASEQYNLLENITDLVLNPTQPSCYADLLGLNSDFGDFVSAETSAFMPSQLLLNDLASINLDLDEDSQQALTKPNDNENFASQNKSRNSILDLFNKTPKFGYTDKNDQHNGSNMNISKSKTSDNKMISTPKSNKDKLSRKDMSAWFHLFAELDPLANPDAIDNKFDGNSVNNSHAA